MAAATEHGEDRVAERPLERASRQTSVSFHVSNLWFYGAAPPQQCLQLWRQAPARAANQHFCRRYTVAAIAAVHDGQIRGSTGQDRDLLQGFGQSVPIVGIARQGTHADDEALVDGSGQADLGSELR